jgi:uncharacterized protein
MDMLLDLSKIIDMPGASIDFSVSLDLSDLEFGSCAPLKAPVTCEGTVRNTAGVLMTKGTIRAHLDAVCDRCGEDYEEDLTYPLDVVLVTELADEDHEDEGIFPLEGNFADMDEIIRTVFILNMDTKFLCSDDCLGLCCGCGVNLNREKCRCKKEIDPRFAALQQLLNK